MIIGFRLPEGLAGPIEERVGFAGREALDGLGDPGEGRVRVNQAGCLDQCQFGPSVVIYPAGIWYTVRTTEEVDVIIEEHLLGGKPVERLLMGTR